MANRNFVDVMARTRDIKIISGSFRTNGTSAVDSTLNKGLGFTVTRTGVGIYRITLNDKFRELVAAVVTPPSDAGADGNARLVNIKEVNLANKTIDLAIFSGSTGSAVLEDPSNAAAHRISFTFCFRDTSLAY